MDAHYLAPAALAQPGEITSFYAYEGGAGRSQVLLACARLLAAHAGGTRPVLMIDADSSSPGLHTVLGLPDEKPGLLEWLSHCQELLRARRRHGPPDAQAQAAQVLEISDSLQYVERVDAAMPLYLLRVGRVDDSFGERAAAFDWAGLFQACPPLLQQWGERLCARFAHVLIDLPAGLGSAMASLQAILPRKCVALCEGDARALRGLEGMLARTKRFRVYNEDFAQPFVLYPLLLQAGRRAEAQPRLEALMAQTYGWSGVNLDSYLDAVRVSLPPDEASRAPLRALLAWHEGDHMAWDTQEEVALVRAVRRARQGDPAELDAGLALAAALDALGQHYWARQNELQALPCLSESLRLRRRHLAATHPVLLSTQLRQAAALRAHGQAGAARAAYEQVLALLDTADPAAAGARAGLALVLADLGEWGAALAMHERELRALEGACGPEHIATLALLAEHAALRARHGELGRARMLYERLLAGRQRVLGCEHPDTLDTTLALAEVLARCDEPGMARELRLQVRDICRRREGPQAPRTRAAEAALHGQNPAADAAIIHQGGALVGASNGILELEPLGAGSMAPLADS